MTKNLSKVLPILIFTTLATLPLYLIRCKSFSLCVSPIPFTLLEVFIFATFIVWLIIRFHKAKIKKIIHEINQKIPLILRVLFIIFLIAPLVSILFSSDKTAALGIYKAYFIEPFLLFIVILDFLINTKNIRLIIWGVVTSGVWIALISLVEKVARINPFNTFEFAERGRSSAVYATSNAVGLLLGPLVILLLGYYIYISLKKENNILIFKIKEVWISFISVIILLLGVYASGSRGTFIGIFAATFFFCIYLIYAKLNGRTKRILSFLFIVFTGLFFILNLILFININSFSKFFQNSRSQLPANFVSRVCLWEGTEKIIKKDPILGSGLDGFQKAHSQNRTCNRENLIYPHNVFLNFWTETGIFGLISFLGICFYFFINLLDSKTVNFFNLGLAAVFIELLFHGLLDVPYFKNDLSVLFWVILALGLFQINQTKVFTVLVRRVEGLQSRH